MKVIARIHNDFTEKFAIPRQSGIAEAIKSKIIFEPEFKNPDALRGIGEFSHLWLIWEFSENRRESWSPTVRPPRLGGNTRLGVFATRSPFRPNPIGLSSVKLEEVILSGPEAPMLIVSGADLMNGTPIYDIKPYLPYTDIHSDATGGFTDDSVFHHLRVIIPGDILKKLSNRLSGAQIDALRAILSEDPRPAYQKDPERTYTFSYAECEVSFKVTEDTLTVTDFSI